MLAFCNNIRHGNAASSIALSLTSVVLICTMSLVKMELLHFQEMHVDSPPRQHMLPAHHAIENACNCFHARPNYIHTPPTLSRKSDSQPVPFGANTVHHTSPPCCREYASNLIENFKGLGRLVL